MKHIKETLKIMTCKQMGGDCDLEIAAHSSAEMARKMTVHVMEMHPKVAQYFENMTKKEHERWESDFHFNWGDAQEIEVE